MSNGSLREKSIDELVANVAGLASVASQGQVQSIMSVIGRCTIELANEAKELGNAVTGAQIQLVKRLGVLSERMEDATKKMEAGSKAAEDQAKALVSWTRALVVLTAVYAGATIVQVSWMIWGSSK